MSFFNERQREPAVLSERDVSAGPRLGFLGAFEAALDAQVRTESMYADAAAFDREEFEQNLRIKRAGLEPPPTLPNRGLWGLKQFEDAASYFERGEQADVIMADLDTRNQHIERLRRERPDLSLRTYNEMWDTVKQKAKAAEKRWEDSTTTTGGMFGGFLGGMAGAFNPSSDPLNAMTVGVAGAGRTAARRIATEVGAQGAIEALNQFTGVQGARERLGLETSTERSMMQVAGVAAGAGVLRGIGEGAQRWFRNAPNDPAPAPPPPKPAPTVVTPEPAPRLELPLSEYMGPSRRAGTILDAELAHVTKQLDDGVPPWAVKPATATALPDDITVPSVRMPESTLEQLVERADPETYRLYGKLQAQADRLRAEIDRVEAIKEDAGAVQALGQIDNQIAALEELWKTSKGSKRVKTEAKLEELRASREPLLERVDSAGAESAAARQANLRALLMKTDEQMRDLAVPLSRARAAAEEKFAAQRVDPEVAELLRRNNPGSEVLQKAKWNTQPIERIELGPADLERRVPVKPTDKPGATAAERLNVHAREADELAAERVDALAAFARQPLDSETHLIMADGRQVELGTVLHLMDDDGRSRQVTIREWMREVQDDNNLIESVSACSLAKIS